MPDYERSERIAIRQDSHMSEAEAIHLTDAELKAKEVPEAIAKAELLRQKMKLDKAEKQSKKSTRFRYD